MNNILNIIYVFMLMIFPLIVSSNTELPDPTRPATYQVEEIEPVYFEEISDDENINWNVSAIRISENDKSAIINGKLVRVGDDVGPAKVLEIRPLSVVINHEDNKLIVRLYKNQVVKDYKSSK